MKKTKNIALLILSACVALALSVFVVVQISIYNNPIAFGSLSSQITEQNFPMVTLSCGVAEPSLFGQSQAKIDKYYQLSDWLQEIDAEVFALHETATEMNIGIFGDVSGKDLHICYTGSYVTGSGEEARYHQEKVFEGVADMITDFDLPKI